jgi:mannose-6-phosphate isomerase-like protein (cupin superfamily)
VRRGGAVEVEPRGDRHEIAQRTLLCRWPVRATARRSSWGTTRLRVLEDGSNTGHCLGLAESVLAPHDEGFYVISGAVRFTVGDKDRDATAGTLVVGLPGAPHTFASVTDQPAVMLSTFTPGSSNSDRFPVRCVFG